MRWALLGLLLFSLVSSAQDAPPPEVAAALKKLKSAKQADRIEALGQLEKLGDKAKPATSAVIDSLFDKVPEVKLAASETLKQLDPDVHDPLFSLAVDTGSAKRSKAIKSLGDLGAKAKSAAPLLKKMLASQDIFDRTGSLDALVAIDPKDEQVVAEVLRRVAMPTVTGNGNDDYVKMKASGLKNLDAIDTTNEKRAKAVVAAMGTDLSGQKKKQPELIELLESYGPDAKVAVPLLTKLRVSSSEQIRTAATKALEAIQKKD